MLKLSKIQREILQLVHLNASTPLPQIARSIGIKERTARYQVMSLREKGIIREAPFLNIYPLGLRYVNLYFSLGSAQSQVVSQLLAMLIKSEKVSWLAELGGDFHYGMALVVRHMEEVLPILETFSERFPALFFEKSYVFHVNLKVFAAKFLLPRAFRFPSLGYAPLAKTFEADELDWQVLHLMSEKGICSGRALARELGKPHATIEFRIKRLEKAGVIAGYWHVLDVKKLGLQTLKLLVSAKGLQHKLSEELFEFCKAHPHISYFIECIGNWDFEIGLDVEQVQDVAQVSGALFDKFGTQINSIKVVPMFRVLKWKQLPLKGIQT